MKKISHVLVIAPHYTSFIKGLVDATAAYVSEITVLVRYNPLSELAQYIPVSYFRHVEKYSKKRLVDLSRTPENINVHIVPLPYFIPDGRNKKLGDKLFRRFGEYIRENNIEFDLIHAHFTWPHGYAAAKLKNEFNVPLVITAHGYDVYDLPFRDHEWSKKVKYALDIADHVITVSKYNKNILLEKLGVSETKISIIPNGFDSEMFYPIDKELSRSQLGLPLDKKIILNVANLVPVKGHEYLIKAMKKVIEKRDDVILIIVGDGPLSPQLKNLVKKLDLESFVRFMGTRPHDEIPLWMNAADVFVLSSIKEGAPTSLLEALGSGIPIVATEVGGVPDMVSRECGVLCPAKDHLSLSEAILHVLEKSWSREEILSCVHKYRIDVILHKVIKIYDKCLQGVNHYGMAQW